MLRLVKDKLNSAFVFSCRLTRLQKWDFCLCTDNKNYPKINFFIAPMLHIRAVNKTKAEYKKCSHLYLYMQYIQEYSFTKLTLHYPNHHLYKQTNTNSQIVKSA